MGCVVLRRVDLSQPFEVRVVERVPNAGMQFNSRIRMNEMGSLKVSTYTSEIKNR
jgi:hypothetical protein